MLMFSVGNCLSIKKGMAFTRNKAKYTIKKTLDPNTILNPGKVVRSN